MNEQTIVLIDLSGIAHPVYATLSGEMDPEARLRTGQTIVQRVHGIVGGHRHVAVCCDAGRSFRHDIEPTYKAQRPERDEVFTQQIKQARETLAADGFPVWACPGFEADDVIATATAQARAAGREVQIVSADKDLLALVTDESPAVRVRKPSDGSIADVEIVAAKFGVLPAQMTDYLTLVGDASDNVAGAKGIGPKGAVKLLAQFHTLDDLVEALAAGGTGLTPSVVQALRDFLPRMEATRKLIRMRTDAPIANFAAVLEPRTPPALGILDAETVEAESAERTEQVEQFMAAIEQGPAPKAEAAPAATTTAPTVPAVVDVAITPQVKAQAVQSAPVAPSQALVPVVMNDAAPAPIEFERQLEPRSFGQATQLAEAMFKSRLFAAYGTPQGVLATVLAGREMGLQSMAALRAFHIVEGKPTMAADLIRALVLRSGLAEYFRCVERTNERATFVTRRKGDPKEIELTFSVDDAKLAQLGGWNGTAFKSGSGWAKSPADQCVARAGAKLARLVYPDVVHGIYATEELEAA